MENNQEPTNADIATVEQEELKKVLDSTENKQRVLKLCSYLEEKFNGNWFTIEKMAKKTKFTLEEARDALLTINMFGYLAEVNKKGKLEYKVIHTKEAQLSVARLDKQMLLDRLKEVDKEIEVLEAELKKDEL
jgi:hypothetical protein